MNEVRKIVQKIILLGLDILLFAWQVVRRVILPTRNRKGNILSSLLTFFLGLVERIVSFEKSILQRPVFFTHKYVKQALIVAVGFLFLLTSFEWAVGSSPDSAASGSSEVISCARVTAPVRMVSTRTVDFFIIDSSGVGVVTRLYNLYLDLTGPPVLCKRWIRFGVFRI